jgi:hypothetical protein
LLAIFGEALALAILVLLLRLMPVLILLPLLSDLFCFSSC